MKISTFGPWKIAPRADIGVMVEARADIIEDGRSTYPEFAASWRSKMSTFGARRLAVELELVADMDIGSGAWMNPRLVATTKPVCTVPNSARI